MTDKDLKGFTAAAGCRLYMRCVTETVRKTSGVKQVVTGLKAQPLLL